MAGSQPKKSTLWWLRRLLEGRQGQRRRQQKAQEEAEAAAAAAAEATVDEKIYCSSTPSSGNSRVSPSRPRTTPVNLDKPLPKPLNILIEPVPPRRPSVAIIGGGIAGLGLAISLVRHGVPCTIYDAYERLSAVGAGIGLGPNALDALGLIDPRFRLLYEFARTGNESAAFSNCVFDARYAEDGLDFGASRKPEPWLGGAVGAPYFERSSIHRRDLLQIMESFVPPHTMRFSKRLVAVRQEEDGGRKRVRMTFQDGEVAFADAMVGCDGIKGLTRRAVLEKTAPRSVAPEYCNMYLYRAVVPMREARAMMGEHSGDAKIFMAHGCYLSTYPMSQGCELNVDIMVRDKGQHGEWMLQKPGKLAVPCPRAEMEADLAALEPSLRALLCWSRPLRWPLFHHRNTPSFSRGRICLLGDVAHATTPHHSAGAGQVLEDAVVLGHLLAMVRHPAQIEAAFRAYDEVRRPRAAHIVNSSIEAGAMYCFEGPAGDDMRKILDRAEKMLQSIWIYDLQADVRKAEDRLREQIRKTAAVAEPGAEDDQKRCGSPVRPLIHDTIPLK